MGKRIAITGSSSTMAKLLITKLLEMNDITLVRGLDVTPTNINHPKFEFSHGDVRNREDLAELLDSIDIIIHMAFIVFSYPKDEDHLEEITEINVEGSKNVFEVAASHDVNKIIYISSVASYGLQYDRNVIENPLSENDELSGATNNNFYLTHKKEVELFLDNFQDDYPKITITRIRPHILAGSEYIELVNLKPYKDGLKGSFYTRISQPEIDDEPHEQLVHEQDVIKAILYAVKEEYHGPINVAGDPVELKPYLNKKSIRLLHVPLAIARFVLWFKALFSDIGRLERYWTTVMVYPLIVDNSKFKELIGTPKTTEDIFNEIYNFLNE